MTVGLTIALIVALAFVSFAPLPKLYVAGALLIGAHWAARVLLSSVTGNEGLATTSLFLLMAACWLLAGAASPSSRR